MLATPSMCHSRDLLIHVLCIFYEFHLLMLQINFKVTCLISRLLLYWPKIHRIFFISRYFGIGSDSFYFLHLKFPLLDIKILKKKATLACKFNVKWIVREADIKNRFLKNTRLRPLRKINVNVSNFLTRYRTIVFFKEEKNLSGLLI